MPLAKKIILIDAGHGGWDPGKVAENNICEKLACISHKNSKDISKQCIYITCIKDISSNDTAMAYENVAIISDMDDLYIECRDLTLTNYKVEDYMVFNEEVKSYFRSGESEYAVLKSGIYLL